MSDQSQNQLLATRLQNIVDRRLFAAFWDGATHFGTKDLVLLFDENDASDPLSIIPRTRMIAAHSLSKSIKNKVRQPARSVAQQLTDSETAFWLIVIFTDGESCCVAINAKPIAPGGHA